MYFAPNDLAKLPIILEAPFHRNDLIFLDLQCCWPNLEYVAKSRLSVGRT